MSYKDAAGSFPFRKIEKLLKVLDEQHHVLVSADGNKKLIVEYAALIQFLKMASSEELRQIFSKSASPGETVRYFKSPRAMQSDLPDFSEDVVKKMTVLELEELVQDDTISRKVLETIAIYRFNVPKGSMRSFSNRERLVEKLMTLLRNEQAHLAIETVTKRQL